MEEAERYEEICKPQLEAIWGKVDKLCKVLIEGNGKKSLVVQLALVQADLKRIKSRHNWLIGTCTTLALMAIGIMVKAVFFSS